MSGDPAGGEAGGASRPRRVLLGVSGGIAAYKAAEIVRLLRSEGHEVRCALTRGATSFVTPLTLEVLSGEAVYQEEYLLPNQSGLELHIEAAQWADVLVCAPVTAHLLARLALGLADDFLTTTALAFDGPLVVAPAMHSEMWGKPAVRRNAELLRERGAHLVGPEIGRLASGEIGIGRMADPAEVAAAVARVLSPGRLAGRTVLITAGPTREAADPVRYLSNRSSGKMGFALAAAAAAEGARVLLVAGPVERTTPPLVERIDVVSALEMRDQVRRLAREADLVVMAAAVSDFRPRQASASKLKKSHGWDELELEPNPDILAELAAASTGALLVGFAAETDDLEAEALRKLEQKGVDFVVANDVSRAGVGFESDQNEVTVFARSGEKTFLGRRPKRVLAGDLMRIFAEALTRAEPDRATVDR